jgi:hypothetical protein
MSTNQLAIIYPQKWRSANFTLGSSMSSSLAILSNQAMHNPCMSSTTATGSETSCHGWPIDQLHPGGIFVEWDAAGSPGWSLGNQRGKAIEVGGLPAREQSARPGFCSDMGASETISLVIAARSPSNYFQMTACLKGPALSQLDREVTSMVKSARFPNG